MLTRRLKHLEQAGVVIPRFYSRRPPRAEYLLTERGRELGGALRLLTAWGSDSAADQPNHEACGTPMQPRWHCPTCDRLVDEAESDLRWL